MHYAKPRPMDPRSLENTDEILDEALGEMSKKRRPIPSCWGFFR